MANKFKTTSIERTANIEVIEIDRELIIECTKMSTLIDCYGIQEVGLNNIEAFLQRIFATVGVTLDETSATDNA